MALEPITRQEKIIAGQDLTPITRMEKFLKQYGGGSGGVTSWNDLTDKPFGEVTTVKEVLAECQPEFNSDGGAFVLASVPDIVVGKTYIVSWNGVDYSCVAQDASAMSDGTIGLGNLADFGAAGNGEPFAIVRMIDSGIATCGVIPLDGSTTLTISIRQEVTEVKKISGKYVEGMGYSEAAKTVIFSGDVEMVGQDVGGIYFTTARVPTGLSSLPEELTVTVDGISTVVKVDTGSFVYNERNVSIGRSKDDSGNWTVLELRHGGNSNYTIEDITIEAVTETVHPIDEKLIVLTSPNGTQYNLSVADDGTLSAVAAT